MHVIRKECNPWRQDIKNIISVHCISSQNTKKKRYSAVPVGKDSNNF